MTQCGTSERYAAYSDYTTGSFSVSEDNFQLNIAYGNTESLADGGVEMDLDGTVSADGKDVVLDFTEKSMRNQYIAEIFEIDSDKSLLGYRISEGVIVFETYSDVTLESLAYTKIDEIP